MANNFPRLDRTTKPGRMVGGSLTRAYDKDSKGKPRDKPQFWIAVAIPKADAHPHLIELQGHAWTSYAAIAGGVQGVHPRIQAYPIGSTPAPGTDPSFAWKIHDGDAPANRDKEGYAGCWIFNFSTVLPIKTCDRENRELAPSGINLGDYVDVAFSSEINGNVDKTCGIYLNPQCVRLLGYGQRITTGPTAAQLMGSTPAPLPPGASLTPVAPSTAPGGPAPLAPHTVAPGAPPVPGAPAAPVAPPAPAAPVLEDAVTVAARHGVTHYAGHRFNPTTRAYEPDTAPPAPAPVAPPAPIAPPAPAAPVAPVLEDAATVAARHGVQHYAGHRFNPATRAYEPDQAPAAAPPAPPAPAAPMLEDAATVAARHGVTHYAGHRFNPTTNAYEPDQAPVGNPVAAPGVPAGAVPVPAPGVAPSMPPVPPAPGIASPSSVVPVPGYARGV